LNLIKIENIKFWITNFQLFLVFVACLRGKMTTVGGREGVCMSEREVLEQKVFPLKVCFSKFQREQMKKPN